MAWAKIVPFPITRQLNITLLQAANESVDLAEERLGEKWGLLFTWPYKPSFINSSKSRNFPARIQFLNPADGPSNQNDVTSSLNI